MAKRLSKAERTNQLIVYCVERDRAAIANASFLLAAFLLIVAGKTAAQAAERFTGPCAPYLLAPFRDASFCRQVISLRSQMDRHARNWGSAIHKITEYGEGEGPPRSRKS